MVTAHQHTHLSLHGSYLTDLGRPRRNGKSPGGKTVPWETTAWENACLGNWVGYPGQTDAWLRLGSGVGLSGILGCSCNLSLTRCIKNNGQQKWPATSSSQSDSDTPTNYPSRVFTLKNPALRTTERILTSLGWLSSLPWLAPLALLFPTNKPCSLAHCVHLVS